MATRQDRIEAEAAALLAKFDEPWTAFRPAEEILAPLRAALAEPYVCEHCEHGGLGEHLTALTDAMGSREMHRQGPGGIRCSRDRGPAIASPR
jgi:hypothetical protein